MVEAAVQTIYQSDCFSIRNFECQCSNKQISTTEYSHSFNISFVRTGNFLYHVFRSEFDVYNGFALVDKPGCEHRVGHLHHVPDKCTIFDFTDRFYVELLDTITRGNNFFANRDLFSALVKINPEVDYVHHLILQKVSGKTENQLSVECLVFEMLEWFIQRLSDDTAYYPVDARLKKNHLETIELSKQYMAGHFAEDISLGKISSHCNVSPFHFSRIFKLLTQVSPYRFLQELRLKNAELLIKNTEIPVFDVGVSSGFNSLEHFSAAFRQKYGLPPSLYKSGINSKKSKIS